MRFRILGPLEVEGPAGPLKPSGKKQLGLLALLLLRANRPVPTETLIDGLWDEAPPESAANALQVHVSGLRKLLGADTVLTSPPGYELRVDPADLDLLVFEREIERGRGLLADGDHAGASAALADAVDLWRGRPLVGLALGTLAEAEASRIEELHLAALEDRIEADLELGRHTQVVPELETLAAAQPHRERLAGLLMLALYRSGRQFEALEAYRATRERLAEDLGLDPSPELQAIERRILQQDPALAPGTVAAGAEAPPRARRPVVVVAAELEAGPLDPEAEERVLAPAVAAVAEVLERHGAQVECTGWRARGIFGLPHAREDDALRAMRAAVELRDSRAKGAVGVRVGIAGGEVVAGAGAPAGAPLREAEELARAAEPGEVLVGERPMRLVPSALTVEAGEGRWRLELIEPGGEAIPRRHDTRLVGRKTELARLRAALDDVVGTRTCGLALVTGTPGIGKTRLAQELDAQAGEAATCVTGRCLAHGEGSAFGPLAEIVEQLTGETTLKKLLRGERQAGLVQARLAALLAGGDEELSQGQAFWSVRRLLEAVARKRPLLVCLDDLHWGDEALLDLVEYLADWVREVPVLLVLTGRSELLERRPGWTDRSVHLPLEPLRRRDADRMLGALLPDRGIDAELRARITGAAEGNPLFIEQMAAIVGEEQADAGEVVVPPTIHALIAARLDLLAPGERSLLEHGALIGREFSLSLLSELSGVTAAEAEVTLEAVRGRQLLEAAGSGTFRFYHQLIADAAYDTIPKSTRAELHERLAGILERADGIDSDEAIGFHLERAHGYRAELGDRSEELDELGRRAGGFLSSAGLRWQGRGNTSRAAVLLGRAIALPDEGGEARAELLLAYGRALRESGDFVAAERLVSETAAAAAAAGRRDLVNEARVLGLHLRFLSDPGFSYTALMATAEEAIAELEVLGDQRGLADAWYQIAWAHWLHCQAVEAGHALDRVDEHARASLAPTYYHEVLRVGIAVFGPAPVSDGIARCEAFLAGQSVPLRIEAAAHRGLAALKGLQGRFDEGRAHARRDEELVDEAGLRVAASANAEVAGMIEMLAGDPETALLHYEQGMARLPVNETSSRSTMIAACAEALYALGRLDETIATSELSEQTAAADDYSVQVQWRTPRAKALAVLGDHEQARALVLEALELASGTDFALLQANALLDAAEVHFLGGLEAEGVAFAARAVEAFERKGDVVSAERARVLQREGVTRAASGRRRSSSSAATPASTQTTTAAGNSAE